MQRFLPLRAILFVILLPGTVAGYVPFRVLRASGRLNVPLLTAASLLPGVVLLAGVAVLLSCVWQFFASGHGTLAPVDPPRRLVVTGLYRFTRNPMYNGVLLTLFGEAWLFRSLSLIEYTVVVLVVFHLFVVFFRALTLYAEDQEIMGENVAAAVSYAGAMLAIALIVGHAVEGDFEGWGVSLGSYAVALASSVVLYPVRQLGVQTLMLRQPFALRGGALDRLVAQIENR